MPVAPGEIAAIDAVDRSESPLKIGFTKPLREDFITLLSEGLPLKDALRKYERLIIEMAIQKYGSQDEVAKILKVDQGTISRKIKIYSLAKKDVIIHK